MGKYPVTNGWYAEFVRDGGYRNPEFWTEQGKIWLNHTGKSTPWYWYDRQWNCPNSPVVGVCWYEAAAFCRWLELSRNDGHAYALPDENQWEAAAAGRDGRKYPWDGEWKEDHCNSKECGLGKTSPVGTFPKGDTAEGLAEMGGNVWEWTQTNYYSKQSLDDFEFRGDAQTLYEKIIASPQGDERQALIDEWVKLGSEEDRQLPALRGGAWDFVQDSTLCAARFGGLPDYRYGEVGFRCARTES